MNDSDTMGALVRQFGDDLLALDSSSSSERAALKARIEATMLELEAVHTRLAVDESVSEFLRDYSKLSAETWRNLRALGVH